MLLSGTEPPLTLSSAELMAIALSSAADGVKPFAGTAAPVGYQPSVRYWRIRTTAPLPDGDAIDVPVSAAYELLVVPTDEYTVCAGLQYVGLRLPSAVGPRLVPL